ncbi:MAG: MFS transporter [Desulfovibrio sp.]
MAVTFKDCPDQTAKERITLLVVSVVQFLGPFMASAVGVALPAIGRAFNAGAAQLGRVEVDYLLAFALILIPAGRFSDIYGRKKVFTTGLGIFSFATVMLCFAWSIESFIAMRFVQGAGSAMITGTSMAILTSVFPACRRGYAMGIVVGCLYIALSAGPALGGVMVTHLGWQSLFYGVLPFCAVAMILILRGLKDEWADAAGETFDWKGAAVYVVALSMIVYGLTADEGKVALGIAFCGVAAMIYFVWLERKTSFPVLDVKLIFSNREFAFSNLATFINYASSFSLTFLFSLYLQYVKGFTPQIAGVLLIVQPIVQSILAPISGKLSDKYPPTNIASLGMILCAAGIGVATLVDGQSSLVLIGGMLFLLGLGFGFFSTPNLNAIMGSVKPEQYGTASGFVSTMRTMGMLSSMTFVTLMLRYNMGDAPVSVETQGAFLLSMHTVFLVFLVLSLLGVGFSFIRNR